MKGVTPDKENQIRFEIIREIGCVVCKKYKGVYTPPQIHHLSGCKDQEAHKRTIGLCYWHHMADQQTPPAKEYTSRHPNKKAFERRYGSEETLLYATNRAIKKYTQELDELETTGVFE